MKLENSDSLLLEKIQEGDEYAFEITFLKYYAPMSKYIWKYLRSEDLAEEVVQEVFANLWNSREELDPRGHLRGLLYEMARNKALDTIKHQKVVDSYITETRKKRKGVQYNSMNYKDESNMTSFMDDTKAAIADLPPKARQVYILNREEGLTYKEIANYLGISIKTVESQMSRVLRILRGKLSKYVPVFMKFFLGLYSIIN